MNKLLKSGKRICAMLLGLSLCIPFTTVALAANEIVDSDKEIEEVLERINLEYGTQICVAPENDTLDNSISTMGVSDMYQNVDLEETLRYICEVQIPKFDYATQRAQESLSEVNFNEAFDLDNHSVLTAASGTIIAKKNIDYATAYVEAYTAKDSSGNTIWGRVVDQQCLPHTNEKTLFVCDSPTVTHRDGNRTLYWVGDGDYYSFINGKRYYLRSGTQSASMSISSYIK